MHFGRKYGNLQKNKHNTGVKEANIASLTPFCFAKIQKKLVYFYAFFTETKNAQTGATGEI